MKYLSSAIWILILLTITLPVLAQTEIPDKKEKIYVSVEEPPKFIGGDTAMFQFLGMNTRYPMEAQQYALTGTVIVSFVIDSTGQVKNPTILKSAAQVLDAEAIRVVQSMPAWKPGKQLGQPVAVKFNLPIRFNLPQASSKEDSKWHQNSLPQFPGGEVAMAAYFANQIKYPPAAAAKNIEGRVIVSFKVLKDGRATDFKIENIVHPELAAEALRVLEVMPLWEPAVEKGYKVKSQAILEIPFVLAEKPTPKTERAEEKDPVTGKMIKKPSFPGGEEPMMQFLSRNLRNPKRKKGLVSLKFMVDSTGVIRNIRVIESAHESLEAEAIRVVEVMPRWEPGEKDDRPADMDFTLPIRFSIK